MAESLEGDMRDRRPKKAPETIVEGLPDERVYRRPFPLISAIDAFDDDPTVLAPPPVAVDDVEPSEEELFREPSGIVGTLRQVSVAEVVQGLEMGRKTARVDICAPDNRRGRMFIAEGQLVHAEHDGTHGLDAFFLLAELKSGAYRVRFERTASERTIHEPTAYVVLEAMRRLDEREHASSPPVSVDDAAFLAETKEREALRGGPVLLEEDLSEIDDSQVLAATVDLASVLFAEPGGEEPTLTEPAPRRVEKTRVFSGFFQEAVSDDDGINARMAASLAFIGDSGSREMNSDEKR